MTTRSLTTPARREAEARPRRTAVRAWAVWTAGFLVFPIAGLAGTGVAGRVDSALSAVLGGAAAGLVVGAGQAALSGRRLDPRRWVPATAVGMGGGLLLGAAAVDYGTSLGELALMGALSGVVLGAVQALALPPATRRRWLWAAAMPALWSMGWVVMTLAGLPVEEQFTLFGMSGALAFSAASGALLHALVPPAGAGR